MTKPEAAAIGIVIMGLFDPAEPVANIKKVLRMLLAECENVPDSETFKM